MWPGDDANVRAAALDELSGLQHAVAKHESVMYLYVDIHGLHRGYRRPAVRGMAGISDCNLANFGAQQGLQPSFSTSMDEDCGTQITIRPTPYKNSASAGARPSLIRRRGQSMSVERNMS